MRILRASLISFALFAVALSGCREEDVIRKETITHEDREPLRLRVAFIMRGKSAWFFRFTGPAELIKLHEATFDDLVKSVKFDDKKEPVIEMTDPKGWQKDPASQDRFAAYRFKDKGKDLDILVSELSSKGFDLVDNMHRWQKKVNAPLVETLKDAEAMVQRTTNNGLDIAWIDMSGLGVHAVTKPAQPMAKDGKKFQIGIGAKQKPAPAGLAFKYKAPEKWVQEPPRQFVLDGYSFTQGDEQLRTTISVAGGGIGANISRWRKQVLLPKVDDDVVEQAARKRKIAGIDAYYVDLDNPRGPAEANRILGAIIPVGGQLWFVKMTGPRDLVGQQQNAFETFLDSFQREGK